MLQHVGHSDWMRLNASLLYLRIFLRSETKMEPMDNYSKILLGYNITQEDIDLFYNYSLEQDDPCYCSGFAKDFALGYKKYHGYVALMVCVFGTVANLLNVIVLTRKDMAIAPINRILTGLAIADMLVMLEYIPFALYKYLVLPEHKVFPYGWAVFVLFHMHFTQLFHTISIALTLTLAVWRYVAIRFPQYNHSWCTAARCRLALCISFLAPLLACAPSYLLFGIKAQKVYEHGHEEVLYHVDAEYSDKKSFVYQLNFWMLGVVVKLLPCVILTVISCWLIKALYRAKGRKQALRGYNQCGSSTATTTTTTTVTETATTVKTTPILKAHKNLANGYQGPRRPSKSERRADRTTRMLVAVLLLFLVTEIPQGVLGLLSGVLGECFFRSCYHNFGEIMDILALLNGAINFILYCSMSRQFRTTFGQLFKPQIMKKWQPSTQQTDVQSTYV
ncbi:G-protein coupled receptor dmsr-1 [Prorops nasuta]|uniref:G-protein coupled receptor dmsr-1 n=1 Tax=Prorops nasuta TaxID=863751 RepID=UPI0034CD4774